jgi:hypothetical protein
MLLFEIMAAEIMRYHHMLPLEIIVAHLIMLSWCMLSAEMIKKDKKNLLSSSQHGDPACVFF